MIVKTIAAGVIIFGAAMTAVMFVNSSTSKYSWMAAGALYILALFLVQLFQSRAALRESIQFNAGIASVVTILAFVDTLVLHRGIFKDISRSGEGLLYRLLAILIAVGIPTVLVGSMCGLILGRILQNQWSKVGTQSSEPPIRG